MKTEIIIRACEITAQHYRSIGETLLADAFQNFRNSIIALEERDAVKEEQDHAEALEDAMGSHGQG